VQSFSADESRLLVRGIDGTAYLYDTETLQPFGQVPVAGDLRWDPADPDLLYFFDETRLMAYNVRSGEESLVHEFAGDFPGQKLAAVWTRWEGSPSADGRYWGLMAEDEDWVAVAFLVYDRQTDQVIAKRDLRDMRGVEDVDLEDIDHVTISPLGDYFIASFSHCERGKLGDDAHPCGLMVYDRDLTKGRGLLRIIGHYDVVLDAEGREAIFFGDIDTDNISVLDLAIGTLTHLWPIDFTHTGIGMHLSGCAYSRPGWALVSTHDDDPAAYTWMDDQVFAVELKPGGRVLRLAHTHSLLTEGQEHEYDYWAEPHASVNRDFTRIVFTSNWGRSGTAEVETFLIELPPDWAEWLP
jgi:hypothetical protein